MSDTLQILQAVNGFYDSAWSRLVTVVGILIGVGAVVVPLFVAWMQNRAFRKERMVLEEEAKKQIAEIKQSFIDTTERLKKQIEEKIKAETERLDESSEGVFGALHMLQAQIAQSQRKFGESAIDYARSVGHLLAGKDYANAAIAIDGVKDWLRYFTIEDFSKDPDLEKVVANLVSLLSDSRHERRFVTTVEEIVKLWKEAKGRIGRTPSGS